ncbi:MAG: ABC transporter permease [Gammaproteobacteria bacterium]|nr:ABC transporter permease [Gammaproteobacteria bacterium]MCY4211320.1 ABC transporter permease [Gammaproteobacteria bacterium]MCY4283128.1 ABC transporter permease [Gammaproteobacteria bacterium]MCY4339520.1 ABC transporter permease [Gammaproteobacteria bacterium]
MFNKPRTTAILLALPLTAFILVTFVAPLGSMFMRSLYDPLVADIMPGTVAALAQWDGTGLPSEQVYALAARELERAREERTIGKLATRLNRDTSGLRSVITRTGRALKRKGGAPWSESLPTLHAAWGEPAIWQALARTGARVTPVYYLNAVDLTFDGSGAIVRQPEERRIYATLFIKTLRVSLTITLLCLIIGYPVAYLIAQAPPRQGRLLLVLVLVPFWTSLLVRTTSWIVLLQQQGVVNDLLVWLGLAPDDQRLTMIHNMTGTLVAMTYVLAPFMILPLYSVMRGIPAVQMQAAASLGASWPRAFYRVYLPQSLPGVGAGCLLVFILAIGYYITPALVGGQSGQLISNFIAYHIQTSLNWGLAAALGCVLFVAVLLLFLLYDRVLGIDRMRLG